MRAAMSALHFVNESTIQKGDQVLVYGASGSVGSYAIQLAKYYGANVTAVCSKKNLLLMKKIGADYTIDYLKTDFTKGNKKYDFVFFWKPLNLFRPYLNNDISATFCYQKKNGQQKYKANRSRQKYCHIPCSCTSSLTEIPLNYWT